MRKEASSNALNEKKINASCGMGYALSLIGGRWKSNILWRLLIDGKLRYNELRRLIPGISERMLVSQLREMEADKLVLRIVYPEVPPRVEYELTELGQSMRSMLQSISDWGEMHRQVTREN
ncbi:winged helix-turn-helix transcriptional regulator [Parapedobacter tibetensis]|uniref:winged helix-turn-helix transcriptional regulator n=1 Tax=Parapedobacter tibetensis TaxID=2972951 RepID=UPI0027E5B99C|nr:helix-turn-helix domain-containing protein [Parapedobacter tibetensis]